jgi:hypothetical protein
MKTDALPEPLQPSASASTASSLRTTTTLLMTKPRANPKKLRFKEFLHLLEQAHRATEVAPLDHDRSCRP